MAEDPNPSGTVTDPPGTSGAAGPGNVSTPTALSLEDINKLTGRGYSTLEDAQKGLSETYRFVGSKMEPRVVEKVVEKLPDNVVTREEFDRSEFFRSNPEANKHKSLLEQVAKANGMRVQDVYAGDPENPVAKFFKDTVAKLTVADEAANARSALTSDPRLGIISDDSTKAKEAFESSQKARASGDTYTADRLHKEAEQSALNAVIKQFGLAGKITD